MEKLQGPFDPCFLGEHLDVEGLEQCFVNTESLRFEEEETQFSMPSLEDKMPFLQMLQEVEYPPFLPLKEPNFQTLLKLQHLKRPWDVNTYTTETDTQIQALELESCVTHDMADLHSPVKSEAKDLQNPRSNFCLEDVSPEPNQRQTNSIGHFCKERNSVSSFPWTHPQTVLNETHFSNTSPVVPKERRKRKRTRPTKNKEEVESQRMTHIAVERNRRRQMNDHLNSLRSLMPPSYVQRAECNIQRENGDCEEEAKVKRKSEAAEIEVTVIKNHVNLKIQSERKTGQLLRAIVALDDLRLTVLHLNITTSSETTVLYSFNLKIEDDCKLEAADEIAATVDDIFSIINGS
ncbi:transcription factor bHLH67 isoform X2 [Hevea brasiliensis]|uniref:transcription factor bHLH67 isoform X2 n=1 Tax=Hevea brasiliensis TaxID=3981 RepID=UPI000B76E15C|nr:transcription factor bHLH67 isoform X2 [Hevea brasiliensis]